MTLPMPSSESLIVRASITPFSAVFRVIVTYAPDKLSSCTSRMLIQAARLNVLASNLPNDDSVTFCDFN